MDVIDIENMKSDLKENISIKQAEARGETTYMVGKTLERFLEPLVDCLEVVRPFELIV